MDPTTPYFQEVSPEVQLSGLNQKGGAEDWMLGCWWDEERRSGGKPFIWNFD